jgi:hypothetical protein
MHKKALDTLLDAALRSKFSDERSEAQNALGYIVRDFPRETHYILSGIRKAKPDDSDIAPGAQMDVIRNLLSTNKTNKELFDAVIGDVRKGMSSVRVKSREGALITIATMVYLQPEKSIYFRREVEWAAGYDREASVKRIAKDTLALIQYAETNPKKPKPIPEELLLKFNRD